MSALEKACGSLHIESLVGITQEENGFLQLIKQNINLKSSNTIFPLPNLGQM